MPPILNFIILHRPQQSGRLASDNGNIPRVPFTQRFTRKNCARNQKATERRTRIMYTHARNKTFKIKISVFKGTFTSQCPLILFHYYCNYARYIETFAKGKCRQWSGTGEKEERIPFQGSTICASPKKSKDLLGRIGGGMAYKTKRYLNCFSQQFLKVYCRYDITDV